MKLTIRIKMFFWIGSLTLLFVLLTILLTTILYKPYYLKKQERIFRDLSFQLSRLYRVGDSGFDDEIENLEYTRGFMITLQTEGDWPRESQPPPSQPPPPPAGGVPKAPPGSFPDPVLYGIMAGKEPGEYLFRRMSMPGRGSFSLSMFYKIDENTLLLVTRPMESIDENIAITNRFAFATGLFFLLVGTAAAFFMSKFITRPVNELKSIAESMSELDFSRKYEGSGGDELGDLGQSINSLSDQLNRSIRRLNRLNSALLLEIEKERKIDEMRQSFIANVSHELRTPISLIEGYAEGLMDNVNEEGEKRKTYCEVIIDETRKMEKHVSDLLSLSQIQSGVLPLDYSEFDMGELMSVLMGKFEAEAEKRGFRLFLDRGDKMMVRADRNRMDQVLTNFMTNALNYGGGEKLIRLSALAADDQKVRVSLFNSGSPIAEDIGERIWESYYKADKARARENGGYGLGLSIVKAIQEQHNNRFGMENRSGGVCFWFEIDRAY